MNILFIGVFGKQALVLGLLLAWSN